MRPVVTFVQAQSEASSSSSGLRPRSCPPARRRLVADERREAAHVEPAGGAVDHFRFRLVGDDVFLNLAHPGHVSLLDQSEITSVLPEAPES